MACISLAYDPVDRYLVDCGSSTDAVVDRTRTFVADNSSSFKISAPQTIFATTSSNSIPSVDASVLYRTARVLTGPSSYTFSIQQHGRHWIRLYFFPFVHQNYDMKTAKFSVSTQEFTLLKDYQSGNNSAAVKEFSSVISSDTLVLSFTPATSSFAFINAIEVVSAPDNLFNDEARGINPAGTFQGLTKMALETVYRVNMGVPLVIPSNDTLGRTWVPDRSFLVNPNLAQFTSFSGQIKYGSVVTQEIAPDVVYSTATEMNSDLANVSNGNFNVTWQFDVDGSSRYLIRMHFCDIVSDALSELYFNVFINDWMAERALDLSALTSSLAAAYYEDIVTGVTDGSGKIRVSIGPSPVAQSPNGIMNGLEIMRINDNSSPSNQQTSSKKNVGVIAGAVVGAFAAIVVVVCFFLFCRRRKMPRGYSKSWVPFSVIGGNTQSYGSKFSRGTTSTTLSSDLSFRFPFVALQEATNGFDESCVIGVGGFGKVYKGVLKDGVKVAVKRGNPQSQQGINEFQTEIEMLSKFRHRHLVSLIGYCDEHNEMILVYEYMENGPLKSHLYGSDLPSLSWKQRLEICIGSARGLHYLHTGSAKAVIHRDVKSANILLDENLMAKVADFGLSKAGPELDQTHVSTAVKGSFGYLDPEYFRRQQLTEKSDVYSFGVVLLEVLCARPVIDPTLPREMVNIAEWAMKWQKKGQLSQIVDPRVADQVNSDSLRKFGDTIEKCLADYGVDRPSMGDVLWNLEYALQLQETEVPSDLDGDSVNQIANLSPKVNNVNQMESVTVQMHEMSSVEDLSGVSMSRVFSQLVKAEGRKDCRKAINNTAMRGLLMDLRKSSCHLLFVIC
ncbi:hypothetical protein ACLOJK_001633 [Asimina triloba]